MNPNDPTSFAPDSSSILWSCVARCRPSSGSSGNHDDYNETVILAEAAARYVSDTQHRHVVAKTAQQLLKRRCTPGWEFHSCGSSSAAAAMMGNRFIASAGRQQLQQPPPPPKLKGVKFHLYQHDDGGGTAEGERSSASPSSSSLIVWVFAAVYDSNTLTKRQIQAFLEKIVAITEVFRDGHYGDEQNSWKYGPKLAAQSTFAPILLQRMEEVTYLGQMALLEESLDETKAVMERNITVMFEREDRLRELSEEKAGKLEEMAQTFRKKSKRLRRIKMMQDAKHGVMIGTAIAVGAAIVIVPPLVALL